MICQMCYEEEAAVGSSLCDDCLKTCQDEGPDDRYKNMDKKEQALAIIAAELKTLERSSEEDVKELYSHDFVSLSGFSAKEIHDRMNEPNGSVKIIAPDRALIYMMDGFLYGDLTKDQRLVNMKEIQRRFSSFQSSALDVVSEAEQREILDYLENKYKFLSYMNGSGYALDILNIEYGWDIDSFIEYFPPCYIRIGSLRRRPEAPIGKYSVFARHLAFALQVALTASISVAPASFRRLIEHFGADYDARYKNGEDAFNEFANFFACCGLSGSKWDDWPAEGKLLPEVTSVIDDYFNEIISFAIRANKISALADDALSPI